jgi:hypothetical protein
VILTVGRYFHGFLDLDLPEQVERRISEGAADLFAAMLRDVLADTTPDGRGLSASEAVEHLLREVER